MYQRQGERREALRELNTMVSRHPEFNEGRLNLIRVLVQDGDMVRAKTLARAGLEQSKDNDPTWHAVLGDLAMRENDVTGAIASFRKVFELSPNPGQLLKLTTIQIENGKAADAQALLRENADLVNPQPMLQAVMGRALYATGKTDEAAQVFTRAAERCTNLDQFFAVASQVRQDYTLDETASLLQGLSQQPSRAWLSLTLARLEMADGRNEAAIDRLKALEPSLGAQDTTERTALDQVMAPALHQAGRASEALVYYQRLLEALPQNASVLNNMAYLLAEDLDRPAEALPLAERAAEVEPKNAQILDTLGWVQFKLGQTDEARRSIEASIAAEDLSANHLHLAELLIKQGYRAEARRHLQTAIDLAEQSNETTILQRARELLEQTDELTEAAVTP
jgi:tetratricopeptide (TPR) repeat protein